MIPTKKIINNRIAIIGVATKPISAQFLPNQPKPKTAQISPVKSVDSFTSEERQKVEIWLSYCAMGTRILDTGTKALANMQVIHSRNAIFDLIDAFGKLRGHFSGNDNFDSKERDIEDFLYTFIHLPADQQKRVMRFQETMK